MNSKNPFPKRLKHKLLFFCIMSLVYCLFLPMHLQAQTENEDVGWAFIQEVEGVKFYYEKGECAGQPVLFLKLSNGNATSVSGSWKLTIEADKGDLIFSGMFMPIITGGESTGSCNAQDPRLVIPADLNALQVMKLTMEASIEKE